MHGRHLLLIPLLALFGAGLVINCVLGLVRRDGIYDASSERIMNLSQYLGVIIGLALLYFAYWLATFQYN
jgi:hypothetical protein